MAGRAEVSISRTGYTRVKRVKDPFSTAPAAVTDFAAQQPPPDAQELNAWMGFDACYARSSRAHPDMVAVYAEPRAIMLNPGVDPVNGCFSLM